MLWNVLACYLKWNPTIGYCQGFNFIGAQLIKTLNEEEAFWVLTQILESYLPLDFYDMMVGVLIDQEVFFEIME